jgi:transcriptional regulator NrdR family protein
MAKVRKRNGSMEEFKLSKIVAGCEKAGSTPEQALCVSKELVAAVGERSVVTAEELSDKVVAELEKVNEVAAEAFKTYGARKHSGQVYP